MLTSGPLLGLDAIVLAGGLGTRLAPVLGETPKALAPVHGRPFLAHLLERLAALGVGRAILSLGCRAPAIQSYLAAHGAPLPVQIVVESKPLGTAGGLRLAAALATTDPVLAINGDTWLDADYGIFLAGHRAARQDVSILCVHQADCRRYGRVLLDRAGIVRDFVEKGEGAGPGLISGGVYLFSAKGLRDLQASHGPSLEHDFLRNRPFGTLRGHPVEAPFLDIGTPESLADAERILPAPALAEMTP